MIDSSYEFFTLKNLSLHLLNLGAPPVSQEGEERKIYWIMQSITAYQNCNWLAKLKLREFYLKKNPFSPLKLIGRVACKTRGRQERIKSTEISKLTQRRKTEIG